MGRKPSEAGARTEVIRITAQQKAVLEKVGGGDVAAGVVRVLTAYAMGYKDALKQVKVSTPAPIPAPTPVAKRTTYVGKRR